MLDFLLLAQSLTDVLIGEERADKADAIAEVGANKAASAWIAVRSLCWLVSGLRPVILVGMHPHCS